MQDCIIRSSLAMEILQSFIFKSEMMCDPVCPYGDVAMATNEYGLVAMIHSPSLLDSFIFI